MSDDKAKNKKSKQKAASGGGMDKLTQTLTGVFNKIVAEAPGVAKKVTKKACEISSQVQAHPAFKDATKQLAEVGKKAGEKLGLSPSSQGEGKAKAAAKPKAKPKPKSKAAAEKKPAAKKKKPAAKSDK